MSDSFEHVLERMFAEVPAFADTEAFVDGLLKQLDRDWMFRRIVIGATGGLGSLIAAWVVAGTGAAGQFVALGERVVAFVGQRSGSSAIAFPLGILLAIIGAALLGVAYALTIERARRGSLW